MKHKFNKGNIDTEPTTYPVVGAGRIKISGNAGSICGGRAGFSLGVSWAEHGIDCGGVLSRQHAKELADRIYEILENCEETEGDRREVLQRQHEWN
jgi:hypothetical protein